MWYGRIKMKTLIISLIALCISPVFAEKSAQDQSREYNLIFQQFLREKIERLPKGVTIEVILKDKKRVTGTFEGFSQYDDTLWLLKTGKFGLFSDDAYDISEIQGVRIVVLRSL
jgi:hypothetical protein